MRYIFFIVCFSYLCNAQDLSETEERNQSASPFFIGCRNAGFFSNFLGAIQNIKWALENHRIPIVYWDSSCLYYDPLIQNTQNVWEYYFVPMSLIQYQPGDQLWARYQDPNGVQFPYRKKSPYFFNKEPRREMYNLVQRYIRIRRYIQMKIQTFYIKNMRGIPTIGIHLRGTDKEREVQPVDPQLLLNKANELAKKIEGCQFLVATDEEALLQKAIKQLRGKVIYYNAYRSTTGKPVHKHISKYKIGEDVLIEAMLLSKCDYFIHTRSNVALGVCIFNPEIENIYFEN